MTCESTKRRQTRNTKSQMELNAGDPDFHKLKWGTRESVVFSTDLLINIIIFKNFLMIRKSHYKSPWKKDKKKHLRFCHSLIIATLSTLLLWICDTRARDSRERERERRKERELGKMAASQFSATCSRTGSFSHCDSRSKFIDFGFRSTNSRLLFVRTLNRRPLLRSFSVKSVSSDPTQKLQYPITDEGPDRLSLPLQLSHCINSLPFVF